MANSPAFVAHAILEYTPTEIRLSPQRTTTWYRTNALLVIKRYAYPQSLIAVKYPQLHFCVIQDPVEVDALLGLGLRVKRKIHFVLAAANYMRVVKSEVFSFSIVS